MRFRPWTKGWIIGLLALALTGAALFWVWWRLPLIAERKLTEQLIDLGFQEPTLRVRSVGLRHLEVEQLSAIHGPVRIQLKQGVSRFRPLDLVRPELESVELRGLQIEWARRETVRDREVARPDFSGWRRMLLALPQRVPLRSLTISDGILHVATSDQDKTLFFEADLTNIPGTGPLQLEIQGLAGQSAFRIEGVADAQTGATLTAELTVADANAWLAMAGFAQGSPEAAQTRLGTLSTTAAIRLPSDERTLEIHGLLRELNVSRAETHGVAVEMAYHLKWSEEGEVGLELHTGPMELRQDGLVVFAEKVAVNLQGLHSLEAQFSGVQLTGPNDLQAEGEVHLTAGFVDSWRTAMNGQPAWMHFDLELRAAVFERGEGIRATNSRMRLHRPMTPTGETTVVAEFEFQTGSLVYHGLVVEQARGAGELLSTANPSSAAGKAAWESGLCGDEAEKAETGGQTIPVRLARWLPNAAALRGEARLGNAAFGYEAHLWQVGPWRVPPGLTGTFRVDGVQLRDFEVPEDLAGGKSVVATGEVEARGRFALCPGDGFRWRPQVGLRLERLEYGTHVLTEVRLGMIWVEQQVARVDPAEAWFLGGRLRAAPFDWDLGARNLEMELDLQGVSLEELARQIPQFQGTIEGALNGRLAIKLEAGEVMLRGGRLALDPTRAGRLQYDAEGLLTSGLQPESQEYRRLRLVEEGLEDLRLEDLAIALFDPDLPESPIQVRLEGTSVSGQAVVPIEFTLNLGGDVDPLLRLWQQGLLRVEGRPTIETGP
jgi:hypothetical protein